MQRKSNPTKKVARKVASSNRRGRPSKFTEAVAAEICERLSNGKSLRQICESKTIPSFSTVKRWLSENTEFRVHYARAREEQADFFADEIIEIADNCTDINKARLQIDARKWAAVKLAPKKYGDKLDLGASQTGDITIEIGGNVD